MGHDGEDRDPCRHRHQLAAVVRGGVDAARDVTQIASHNRERGPEQTILHVHHDVDERVAKHLAGDGVGHGHAHASLAVIRILPNGSIIAWSSGWRTVVEVSWMIKAGPSISLAASSLERSKIGTSPVPAPAACRSVASME